MCLDILLFLLPDMKHRLSDSLARSKLKVTRRGALFQPNPAQGWAPEHSKARDQILILILYSQAKSMGPEEQHSRESCTSSEAAATPLWFPRSSRRYRNRPAHSGG